MQPALQTVSETVGDLSAWLASLPDWQAFLLLVGGAIVASTVVHLGGDVLLRRLTRRIPGEIDDVVFGYVHLGLWVTILLGGTSMGLDRLGQLGGYAGPVRASALTIIALTWTYALIRIGPPVLKAITDSSYVDNQVLPIFQNVWTVVVGALSLFSILAIWEIDVTPLLASAGVLGIIVGLAARDTIANFFGSIALYADGTYSVGDYVVLENGERGRVEDVTIRSTVVRTRDDILVTIPNSTLNSGAIVNESAPRRHRRVKIPVSVAYGTDVDRVEELMLAIATDAELVRERPNPRVRLREFGDSGLEVELMVWIDDPRLRGRAKDSLMREIYEAFRTEGIEIPFPQRDLHVRANGEAGVPMPISEPPEPEGAPPGERD